MKRIFIYATAFLLLGIASCGKCVTCRKDGGSKTRICEKDYDSNTAYGFAIDVQEAQGFECND